MKAIVIDPAATPAIYEHDIKGKDMLKALQKLVGGYIEMHRIAPKDVLFVDEEWTMKRDPEFKGKFKIGPTTFGGRGVILGVKGSGNTDVTLDLLDVSNRVTILKRK
jgi:hypothetical protein